MMYKLPFLNNLKSIVVKSKELGISLSLAAVLSGFLCGYAAAKHYNWSDALDKKYKEVEGGPHVQVARATVGGSERVIKLLGEALPYATVTLYAKLSGYLSEILVDKGDRVRKRQLLASIHSPETSSQYQAAVADEKNKHLLGQRSAALYKTGDVSEEERDRAVAAAEMASAKVAELSAQRGYAIVEAPFDGVVTARFVDPGALVQDAARAQSGALPIVTISQTDRFRITAYVNQSDAPFVRVGDPVLISLAERPGVSFEAKVTRLSGELDERTRTMLTEIELENFNGEIVAGGFVDVRIRIKTPPFITIPSQALVVRGKEYWVAVVGAETNVKYRRIEIGDNDGVQTTVRTGLEEDEVVALNVGNNLIEGQHVQPLMN